MRQKLKSGDEYDAVSRRARRVLIFRAGARAEVKRRLSRRARREARQGLHA